jgi:predicted phosphodiesterase
VKDVIRIAAVGDTHVPKAGNSALQPALAAAAANADVLVLCGDITDYGLPEEARLVACSATTTWSPVTRRK